MSTERHITQNVRDREAPAPLEGIIMLIISCFYDTPLSIKRMITNASPDRCFCCRCSHLHATLIWLRGWWEESHVTCGERWRVESCSGGRYRVDAQQVRPPLGAKVDGERPAGGVVANARFGLINEVIGAGEREAEGFQPPRSRSQHWQMPYYNVNDGRARVR